MDSTSHTTARPTYEHIFSKGILVMPVFVTGLLLNSTVAAQTLNFFPGPTDYRIASIDNLTIDGTAYDITFAHGVSYNSLSDPLTFTSFPSAAGALSDVASFILAENVDATDNTIGTVTMFIPYDASVSVAYAPKIDFNPIQYNVFPVPFENLDPTIPQDQDAKVAWLTFAFHAAPPVPEPTTAALFILGLISLGCVRWRRRRR
ncbi:MAG: PEP-CTERM sorting domain-containing protein [Planctomycetales bacterium]|nr:PEP-CTERM sorting domain-containing protein [Planctomycetales bacterium]